MNQKTIIWIITIFLLASTALAATKPIAGQIVNGQGEIELFVEVDFLGNNEICLIKPLPSTGPDGSFATNLGNLIFQNFPQMKCDSFWQTNNQIWYEINYDGELYQSDPGTIESGTGLQYLTNLVLPAPPSAPTTPSSGGGGGSSGGSSSSQPAQPKPTPPLPETTTPVKKIPEVSVQLSKEQQKESIQAILDLRLLNNLPANLEIKIILSDLPNSFILKTNTDQIFLNQPAQKTSHFDTSSINPGQYKLQAFIYHQDKLIAVSNIEKFILKASTPPLEELPAPQETIKFGYGIYLLILALIIISVIARLTFKKIRKQKKK